MEATVSKVHIFWTKCSTKYKFLEIDEIFNVINGRNLLEAAKCDSNKGQQILISLIQYRKLLDVKLLYARILDNKWNKINKISLLFVGFD